MGWEDLERLTAELRVETILILQIFSSFHYGDFHESAN